MRKLLKPALLAFLVILDLGIEEWKRGGLLSPHTPFTLPMAADAMGNPSSRIRSAVEVYFADRGGQLNVDGRKGEKLTIFYFEWDQVDAGSIIEIAGHPPERCNVAAGFAHLGRDPVRRYYLSNGDELIFDSSRLQDLQGRVIYFFKLAWIQSRGSLEIRVDQSRFSRFMGSFQKGRGAGRVLECGVSEALSRDDAWRAFKDEVLNNLTLSPSL